MWARVIIIISGVWLMVAPAIFRFNKTISDNAHIVGPLIATFAIVALSECTRNVRYFNLPLAAWLLFAPWVLHYDNTTALINDYAVAFLVGGLTFVPPKRQHRFGGGWPAIWQDNTLHAREAGNPDRVRLRR